MKISKIGFKGMLTLTIAGLGCSQDGGAGKQPPKSEKKSATSEKHEAHGKGPNGGVVFDLGKHHAEFTVDHNKLECTIIILGEDENTPFLVSSKDLMVTTLETKTKEGKVVAPLTIKLAPRDEKDGKASKFVGTDPGLGNVADFEGTVFGELDGKPANGKFKE